MGTENFGLAYMEKFAFIAILELLYLWVFLFGKLIGIHFFIKYLNSNLFPLIISKLKPTYCYFLKPSLVISRACILQTIALIKDGLTERNWMHNDLYPTSICSGKWEKWGGLRWPSVTWVSRAKRVSKCDKSCWALSSQVSFVHSHFHTKEPLCQRRQRSGEGHGGFLPEIAKRSATKNNLLVFRGEINILPINIQYNVSISWREQW